MTLAIEDVGGTRTMGSRTGRKRKTGDRKPSGRLRQQINRDPGAEVFRARLEAVGIAVPKFDAKDYDRRLRELAVKHHVATASEVSPLDLMAGLGRLHDGENEDPKLGQMRADKGAELAALHRRLFGRSTAKAQDMGYRTPVQAAEDQAKAVSRASNALDRPRLAAQDDRRDAYAEALYSAMRATLKRLGRRTHDAVMNIAIYGRRPTDPMRNPFRAGWEACEVARGLQALIDMPPVARPKAGEAA